MRFSSAAAALILAGALAGSALAEPDMLEIYNTVYGTNLDRDQLEHRRVRHDQRWFGSAPAFRFLGAFTVELNSFGVYLDAGQAEETIELVPFTHSLGYANGPVMPMPGVGSGAMVGFYLQSHLEPDFRVSENLLNEPGLDSGDHMVAYAAPLGGVYMLGFKDHSSTEAIPNDLFVEIRRLSPVKLGDLNVDGQVDDRDVQLLLAAWGPCPKGSGTCWANFDGNDRVDVFDLLILLESVE